MAIASSAKPLGVACWALALCVAGLAACEPRPLAVCAPGQGTPMQLFELFFGGSIPNRDDITDQEWRSFLDDTVTPSLPNGYTVQDDYGAWMSPRTQKTIKEPGKVIVVALPESPDSLTAVDRIRAAYQLRFHQQLVGMTVTPTCGTF